MTTGSPCAGRCSSRRRPGDVPGRPARLPPTSRRPLGRWRRRPVVLDVVCRQERLQRFDPGDRSGDALDDRHLGAVFQVHGDLRVGDEVVPRQRAGAKPETVGQPHAPHGSAVGTAIRAGGGDPVVARGHQPLLGPRPWQQPAGRGGSTEHHWWRGGRGCQCIHVQPPAQRYASLGQPWAGGPATGNRSRVALPVVGGHRVLERAPAAPGRPRGRASATTRRPVFIHGDLWVLRGCSDAVDHTARMGPDGTLSPHQPGRNTRGID